MLLHSDVRSEPDLCVSLVYLIGGMVRAFIREILYLNEKVISDIGVQD